MKRVVGARRRLGRRRLAPRAASAARSCDADHRRGAPMPEAYIVDAVRTPVGKRGGGLSQVHPADLGAHVDQRARRPHRHRPARGRGRRASAASTRSARRPATSPAPAGSPPGSPRRSRARRSTGSAARRQQAVHFAAQAVMSGTNDVIVAGGVQNMSMIPICVGDARRPSSSASPTRSPARRAGSRATARRRSVAVPRRRDDRREVGHHPRGDGGVRDRVATRARSARSDEGRFDREIVPLGGRRRADEGPRASTTLEKMASRCSRWSRAAGSPPRCRARSPTRGAAMLVVSRARAEGARPHAAGPHPPPLACAAPTRSGC